MRKARRNRAASSGRGEAEAKAASGGKCWLVKQEPEDYAWGQLVKEGRVAWTGVRSFPARNFLKQMRPGDRVLYYHSGKGRQVVGLAKVISEPYPDPTASEGDWWCVDIEPARELATPVTLASIKQDKTLAGIALVRQSRLSVMPLSEGEFEHILELSQRQA